MATAIPDPAESEVAGWRVRVIRWSTDETVHVVQCNSEWDAEKVERGMLINMGEDFYTEVADAPRTTTFDK